MNQKLTPVAFPSAETPVSPSKATRTTTRGAKSKGDDEAGEPEGEVKTTNRRYIYFLRFFNSLSPTKKQQQKEFISQKGGSDVYLSKKVGLGRKLPADMKQTIQENTTLLQNAFSHSIIPSNKIPLELRDNFLTILCDSSGSMPDLTLLQIQPTLLCFFNFYPENSPLVHTLSTQLNMVHIGSIIYPMPPTLIKRLPSDKTVDDPIPYFGGAFSIHYLMANFNEPVCYTTILN